MNIIHYLSKDNLQYCGNYGYCIEHLELQYKILWDTHLPNGQRVHIIDKPLDDMFVWRNAIILGVNHVEDL